MLLSPRKPKLVTKNQDRHGNIRAKEIQHFAYLFLPDKGAPTHENNLNSCKGREKIPVVFKVVTMCVIMFKVHTKKNKNKYFLP